MERARPEQHAALLRIWRAAVEATHHFLTPADVEFYAGVVAEHLPLVPDLRVALSAAGDPVGFIGQSGGEVAMLFVDPVAHGTGVGTALLDDVARDHPVLLVDVNEQNPAARGFYESRGFTATGRSPLDGEGRPFPLVHLRRP
ncbi:GNAT family N-acetyltransferase [Actinokineospora bangkokensis]|uniref:GNAT family N-acetyltransferase n=1 Tax=Actinokineospora bangkokensis TaxID=1193682 RepID=A0A1Q9LE41_9PSEU|nr:GNAT family N-acetyltransferase [Actinokineospora bangkokensis]